MTDICPHCLALRAILEATNERLGRPVDSFDGWDEEIPRAQFPTLADVAGCDCRCHAHLRFGRHA